jgi:hypothetical protein
MSRSKNRRKTRVILNNSNRRLRSFSTIRRTSNNLTQYEDRRLWHPEGDYAPARSFSKTRHRLEVFPRISYSSGLSINKVQNLSRTTAHAIGFSAPNKVLICVRRNIRKEVLHALNKTGKGGQNPPRRNSYSNIYC